MAAAFPGDRWGNQGHNAESVTLTSQLSTAEPAGGFWLPNRRP